MAFSEEMGGCGGSIGCGGLGGHRHHGGRYMPFPGQIYQQPSAPVYIIETSRDEARPRCRCPRGKVCPKNCPCRVHHPRAAVAGLSGDPGVAPGTWGIMGTVALALGAWWLLGRK